MAHHNSLMEWLAQTKKLSKSVDYICLDTIDSIINCMHLLSKTIIKKHSDFFTPLCEKYHKPNPVKLILKQQENGLTSCSQCKNKRTCKSVLADYVESSIVRCEQAIKEANFQWMEIVDFFFERPELVDVSLVDEYIEDKISEVCKQFNKNNPLRNGMKSKFGKFWKDENGRLIPERRKRF